MEFRIEKHGMFSPRRKLEMPLLINTMNLPVLPEHKQPSPLV
ncbi:MAG: hypothetical protein WCW68_13975 [Methanothrix sp.]